MAYTEVKQRGKSRYFYRCRTVRDGNRFRKKRVYLGKDLLPAVLKEKKKNADKELQGGVLHRIGDDRSWVIFSAVIVPHLNSPVIEAYKKLKKQHPQYTLDWYYTWYSDEGEVSGWIISEDDQVVKTAKLLDNTLLLNKLLADWKKKANLLYAEIKRLEKQGIRDLKKDYRRFTQIYIDEFLPSLIIESFYMGLDRLVSEMIENHPKHKANINFLIEPCKKTFLQEEQESILGIASMIKKGMPRKDIMQMLQRHQRKFHWVQNNYKYSDPISIDTFYNRVLERAETLKNIDARLSMIRDYEKNRKEKGDRISKSQFTRKEKILLRWCSIISWWQDQRKKANLMADYWMNEFLRMAAERYGYTFEEMQHTEVPELIALFDGKRIRRPVLKQRMKCAMHFVDPAGNTGLVSGQQALDIKNRLLPEKEEAAVNYFRGMTGSVGVAQGCARIVMNPKGKDINKGDVLVTGMTRPEFVPLMKKASAVVTNEGGVTCHAAIICRELGIPCIIGTKIATKALKDGDEVVVNANHGYVRVVKRKKR
jgi:phosphohistidine swiveling domain-containing protein